MSTLSMLTTWEQIRIFSPGGYTLSVRDYSEEKGHHVKHYKVHNLDSEGYRINNRTTYPTIISLIAHHKGKLGGDGDQVQYASGFFFIFFLKKQKQNKTKQKTSGIFNDIFYTLIALNNKGQQTFVQCWTYW